MLKLPDLPIIEVLEEVRKQLRGHHELVLEAPPGAGKTTLVPLVLLDEDWCQGKILVLEPRRIAARAAANRMASLLGESVGQTVGYRMRLDTKVTDKTRIEVITEGVLTRMLQQDPSLESTSLVIFDEFHERHLDSDLALALCLNGRSLFREANPLKLLVMSATLDTKAIRTLLDKTPVITSAGKQFPVDVQFGQAAKPRERIADRAISTVMSALVAHPESSLLVFLPGQGEIRAVLGGLSGKVDATVLVTPLYGNLSLDAQLKAINPAPAGFRKVVLATNIAETSLTIDGISVVIDSGLERSPSFDPNTGLTRLQTRRIAQASATQRAGRAGRLEPGTCYRLWSEAQQQELALAIEPEILQADLAPLALQLLNWGIKDPDDLNWITPPPPGNWQQALALLAVLGAVTLPRTGASRTSASRTGASRTGASRPTLTRHGQELAQLSVSPRLAHLLICGAKIGHLDLASQLAALLSERDPFDQLAVQFRLDILSGELACPSQHRGWKSRVEQVARQFTSEVRQRVQPGDVEANLDLTREQITAYLVACAYPDRVARRRHSGGYQLANGRSASPSGPSHLAKANWLAIAEVGGLAKRSGDIIRSAAPLDPALFDHLLADLVREEIETSLDPQTGRFLSETRQVVGRLVLSRQAQAKPAAEQRVRLLIDHIRSNGLALLRFSPELEQWLARIALLRANLGDSWPELGRTQLLDNLETWLGPYLDSVTDLKKLKKLDLATVLAHQLDWSQSQALNKLAPVRVEVPSGSSIRIDYSENPPVLAVKLQEMFGCEATPVIANGKVRLKVHLLSPAGRPLQVTQDLAGFWRTSYQEVRKEMKGRYPKHPWPLDPLEATATRYTKNRAG